MYYQTRTKRTIKNQNQKAMKTNTINAAQNKVLAVVKYAVTVLMTGFFAWYVIRTIQIIVTQ